MREQARCPCPDSAQPFPRMFVTTFQPLVLPSGPVHEMAIDTPAQRDHHARIEHGKVSEPAPKNRIHLTCEVIQCQSRAPMHLPRGNLPTHIRQLARIDRWQEPRKRPPFRLVEGFPGTKRIPTERERHHWIIPAPPAVLAVHYLRLFRVQPQSDFGEPTPDRVPHLPGLTFGHTMDHHIVCETFEPDTRELPSHPQIEAVMQKKIGEQRGDRAALWRPLYPVGES